MEERTDPNPEIDFMNGYCHVMALAILKQNPSLKIRAHIGWDDDAIDDSEYNIDHVYLVDFENKAYDVRGKFANEIKLIGSRYWPNNTEIIDMTPEDIDYEISMGKLKPYTMTEFKIADKVAERIKSHYGI